MIKVGILGTGFGEHHAKLYKKIDKFTGYRYYDASQLVTVNKLLALKNAGFSLEEIAIFFIDNPTTSSLIKTAL